jgi:phosphonopyruvate decarboxylase
MITAKELYEILHDCDIKYFAGVADSTIGNFLTFIDGDDNINHRRAVNEGLAVASAVGYHLATGDRPCVYLQNSGLGNAINALSSLTDVTVYDIPLILLVGWRGEHGELDEPQHTRMGKITKSILELLEFEILHLTYETNTSEFKRIITERISKKSRIAILVSRGILDRKIEENDASSNENISTSRDVIRNVVKWTQHEDIVFSNTGYTSRDLHAISIEEGRPIHNNFYNIGSMGHVGSLAYEFAKKLKSQRVIVLDGDGSFLMHLGMIAHVEKSNPCNYIHIILDNKSYYSTGGQTSPSKTFSIEDMLKKTMGSSFVSGLSSLKKILMDSSDDIKYCHINTYDFPQTPTPRNKMPPVRHKELFMEKYNKRRI